jgi:hypothetical protein
LCARNNTRASYFSKQADQAEKTQNAALYWSSLGPMIALADIEFMTLQMTPIPPSLKSAILPALAPAARGHKIVQSFLRDAAAGNETKALGDFKGAFTQLASLEPYLKAAGLNTCVS